MVVGHVVFCFWLCLVLFGFVIYSLLCWLPTRLWFDLIGILVCLWFSIDLFLLRLAVLGFGDFIV